MGLEDTPYMFTSDVDKAMHLLAKLLESEQLSPESIANLLWLKQNIGDGQLYAAQLSHNGGDDDEMGRYLNDELHMHGSLRNRGMRNFTFKKSMGGRRSVSSVFGRPNKPQRSSIDFHADMLAEFGGGLGALFSHECRQKLTAMDKWSFDVFEVKRLSAGRPLLAVMWAAVMQLDLIEPCGIDMARFEAFVDEIEAGYNDCPYHSSTHAADVVHGVYWLLSAGGLHDKLELTPNEMYAMLIAAAIHDVDHPGLTNKFLAQTEHPLSLLHSNRSILESHSLATAYALINSDPTDPFHGFNAEQRGAMRTIIIDTVLATDLAHHADLLVEFNTLVEIDADKFQAKVKDPATRSVAMKIAIKCADVSNPTKEWGMYKEWTHRITQEFHGVGDREKALNLKVSPFFDRADPQVDKCQRGFIGFIVEPLFKALGKLLPAVNGPVAELRTNLGLVNPDMIVGMIAAGRLSQASTSPVVAPLGRPSLTPSPEHGAGGKRRESPLPPLQEAKGKEAPSGPLTSASA